MQARTLSEIAELCGAQLEGDGDRRIIGPASLEEAGPEEISFLAQSRYAPKLVATRAGAVVLKPDQPSPRPDLDVLRSEDPNRAFTRIIRAYAPEPEQHEAGVHPTAVVDPTAEIGEGATIGPGCVIEPGAKIGAGAVLVAQVYIGARSRIGAASVLQPSVVIYADVSVGDRCLLHGGVVIGADGFGFEPSAAGWVKIPQCGTVEIGDEVEIGAGSTVDRARFGVTRLANGVKIDNLVQIGHNCVLDEGALVCALVGLAGSVHVGRMAVLGGKVAVNGHLSIGAGAQVGGFSGVHGDLPGNAKYFGTPARPAHEGMKIFSGVTRVPALLEQVRELKRRVKKLEGEAS